MRELVSEYTIVIVTHNMQQAARVSDRTAFFTVEVAEEGTPHGHGRRVRRHGDDVHQSLGRAHRGLRDGEVRMTRESFHEALQRTELELLTLGELAGDVDPAIGAARSSSTTTHWRSGSSRTTIEIDELYLQIDSGTLSLLALQSPVAADLRLDQRDPAQLPAPRADRRSGGQRREAVSS